MSEPLAAILPFLKQTLERDIKFALNALHYWDHRVKYVAELRERWSAPELQQLFPEIVAEALERIEKIPTTPKTQPSAA